MKPTLLLSLFVALQLLSIPLNSVHAEEQTKTKKVYQYKQYERFDLGNLEIKGSVMAPGDISVRERERKEFDTPLMNREDFLELIRDDISELR